MAMVTHRIAIGRPGTWNPCNYPFHPFSLTVILCISATCSATSSKSGKSPALRCDSHHFAPRFHNMASERPPHLNSGDLEQRWFAQLRFGSQWRIHLWRCDHGPCPKHHTHIISHTCRRLQTYMFSYIYCSLWYYWTLLNAVLLPNCRSPRFSIFVSSCSML